MKNVSFLNDNGQDNIGERSLQFKASVSFTVLFN